jgi:integrase/recombinase XerD
MARRGPKQKPPTAPSSPDPQSMAARVPEFLEWSTVRGYAERTVRNNRFGLGYFIAWCAERGVTRPHEVTRPVLDRYQRWLFHYRSQNGRPLSFRSQNARLVPVRAFFRWLIRTNHILYNPAAEMELPRPEKRLPRYVLTIAEAERVLGQPDVSTPFGLRDRAILETLYSTGIRRAELMGLALSDLDHDRGTLLVRRGKNRKDRVVPIGERAMAWVDKYLSEVRPSLAMAPDAGVLFITASGDALSGNHLSQSVQRYVEAAELGKHGSCHLFRHTMATLLLEAGADIRYIQAMLGHAALSTTEIYTRVSVQKLKELHTRLHPGARLGRRAPASAADEAGVDGTGAQLSEGEAAAQGATGAGPGATENDATRAALLASLAADDSEPAVDHGAGELEPESEPEDE